MAALQSVSTSHVGAAALSLQTKKLLRGGFPRNDINCLLVALALNFLFMAGAAAQARATDLRALPSVLSYATHCHEPIAYLRLCLYLQPR